MRKTLANKDASLCIFGKQNILAKYLPGGGSGAASKAGAD